MARQKDYDRANHEALAAVAMAFAPATDVPRDRALVKTAITLLLLNFSEKPFNRAEAVKVICDHGSLPELRHGLANDLFEKLILAEIIKPQSEKDNPYYKFGEEFSQKIGDEQNRIDNLIEQVIRDLFDNVSFPQNMMYQLRKEMLFAISRLMETYGKEYAYQIAGRIDAPVIVQYEELVKICQNVISRQMEKYIKPANMAEAIAELFKQKEPHFAKFVFALTQNYYYLRLLGLGGGLATLSEERFKGSEFFIDTNLLFPFLLSESRHHRSILELMEIAQQLNISLYETEITLEELRNLIKYNITILAKAYDEVPDDLVPNTNSVLLWAYRRQKAENSALKPEEFLSRFLSVRDELANEWGITIFDDPIEYKITPEELNRTKKIINESSMKIRWGKPKNESSQEHDAHLYYVVLAERNRSGDKSAWLLTLDRSLSHAAKKLQPKDAIPFCMTLDGFLHIISPYVRADHQQSFSDIFVELVGNNLFPFEETINIDDFLMFTDFDLSIRNLPSEDVKKVMRKVKRQLDGEVPSPDNRSKVAYEVQKALSDPTLKYRTKLEEEIKEQSTKIESLESEKTLEQKKHELEKQQLYTQFESQLEELHRKINELSEEEGEKSVAIEQLTKGHRTLKYLLTVIVSFILLALIAVSVWFIPDDWIGWVKKQILFKITISASLTFIWLMILVRAKSIQIFLGLLALLATIFAAVAAFSG